jgi:cytochrome c oxidase cbb3-type subunit 3/ubiquinol-cytochrome c reductase cytochrome c subunit
MRLLIRAFFCAAILFTLTACVPPGKPKAEELAASDVTDFKTLFSQNCSGCHGVDGKKGPGRILNDAVYLAVIPKDALKNVITYGRAGTAMPAWVDSEGGPLTARQVDALVDGIESWKKPVSAPPGAELPSYAETSPGDPVNGKRLFVRGCFACHGPGAFVGPVTDPSYLSLSSNQNLRTAIIVGRLDLGMPNYRVLNAGHPLSDQDISDLVAYLVSLRPAAPATGNTPTENTQ